ncbi:MAG: hypothetical protein OIF50_06145 [Flavobacteriaceae bacterium]|nr:hypothetical protein [Flavobacteriaceae bacterium]
MKEEYELKFGNIFIYNTYAVLVINEEVCFRHDENSIVIQILEKHFSERPFVLISYRLFHFTVDPIVYYETNKIKNLVGICVVSETTNAITSLSFEKSFFNKEFKFFNNLDGAKNWAQDYTTGKAVV